MHLRKWFASSKVEGIPLNFASALYPKTILDLRGLTQEVNQVVNEELAHSRHPFRHSTNFTLHFSSTSLL